MKKVVFLLALVFVLASPTTTFAQKVKYERKLNTIFVDEKPYAKLYQVGGILAADYSLKTLQDKEVIFFKYDSDKNFYEVIFMETGEKAYWNDIGAGGKAVAKHVVQNQFIKDDVLNEEAKKRYITLYGTEPAPNVVRRAVNNNSQDNDSANGALVERNKNGHVSASFNTIRQSGKEIGTYTKGDNFSAGTITYTVKLMDGTTIAEAVGKGISPEVFEVTTYPNRSKSTVKVKFSTSPMDDIAKYLVDSGYL